MKQIYLVNCFLEDVYAWLNEPRNRCVEDYHYSLLDMCRAKSVDGVLRNKRLRNEIKAFLYQRSLQMDWWKRKNMDDRCLSRATTIYIRNLCN